MATKGTFCIIQLNRLGDLIQTYQAVKDLKCSYPDVQVKLIARQEFYAPLSFLIKDTFDEVILINKEELLAGGQDLEVYMKNLNAFLNKPQLHNNDVLINLSFCETSNYLMSLIPAAHRLGPHVSFTNNVVVKDQWGQFVNGLVMGGPQNPFNLIDIFKSILGLKDRDNWKDTSRHIGNPQTLALHPFASQKKKRWKPQKWAEVLYKLLKESDSVKVKIFGAKDEALMAQELLKSSSLTRFSDRIENHVGKHSLEGTYNELLKCSHFVGHDSAIGHLAKVANLATVTIALGTVRPLETAPYGINTFIVSPKTKCFPCFPKTQCSFYQCHADLSYQAVTEIIRGFVTEDDINYTQLKEKVSPFHLDSLSISRLGPSNLGWYAGERLDGEYSLQETLCDIFRIAFLYKTEELEENLSLPKASNQVLAELKHLQSGVEQLFQLCEFGKKYSKDIIFELAKDDPKIAEVKRLGDKIQEVDQLMDLLLNAYPSLRGVVDFYKIKKSNLNGDNVVEISESSYLVYNDQGILCSLIYDLMTTTISSNQIETDNKSIAKEGNA